MSKAAVFSLDSSALADWTAQVQKQGAKAIEIHGSTITMQVEAEAGQKLLTTIPFDKGWKAEIDGNTVPIEVFQNTFIELPLTAGTHEITLHFWPRGLTLGLAVSAAGALMAFVGLLHTRKKRTAGSGL